MRQASLWNVVGMLLLLTAMPSAGMPPMHQIGPQSQPVEGYSNVVHVTPGEGNIAKALASINDASAQKRYAVLVDAGTYNESGLKMKPYVDMYGGFAGGDLKARDVFQNATIIDGQKKGPVVIGADNARLDGFVITGGEAKGHGAGILCDGVSPIIANNIITGNQTLKPDMKEGLGLQIAHEGAGIALLGGSRAEVINNLICDNNTEIGAGAGLSVRQKADGKILRNVICNNTSGLKDNAQFHGKEGTRSSPGGAIMVSDNSSPEIAHNVIALCTALYANDAGGIMIEWNSKPPIHHNWIAGNTAYDDGGGIYAMGDLHYDEQGARHAKLPDAPVKIEDNLIVGNDAVLGGPGGVRVSKEGRAELRGNRLIGNLKGSAYGAQGGEITVMENNTDEHSPRFQFSGDITARKFDQRRCVTEFTTSKELGKQDLSGAGVRIGQQWSIVQSNTSGSVTVWGKITDESPKVEVLDFYGEQRMAGN